MLSPEANRLFLVTSAPGRIDRNMRAGGVRSYAFENVGRMTTATTDWNT